MNNILLTKTIYRLYRNNNELRKKAVVGIGLNLQKLCIIQ